MFGRIFIYKLKSLLRNRYLVGWNVLFPLVLATAFFLGFGNMIKDDPDSFETIEVGYVNTKDQGTAFGQVLEELSKETEDHTKIININYYDSKEQAIKAMDSGEIHGSYIEKDEDIETILPANGYRSTVMNQIVREYQDKKTIMELIAADHPESLQKAQDILAQEINIVAQHDFGNNTSPYLQYFFALIAMSSLFSSWISTSILMGMCANLSEEGKRFECAPTSKLLAIVAGICAGLIMQSVSNAVVIIYVEYVLKISLGAPLLNLILISTLGSALGISAGVLIGSLVKNEKYMVVVPLCFSMASSFCSGLMWHQIKQIIESNVPIINRINPASLLTDCFYVRATYGKTEMYYQDIRTMCLLIVGCLLISGLLLRRRKYGSL